MADGYDNGQGETTPKPDEPKDSAPWLALLKEAERCDAKYQTKCDSIDKLYADIDALTKESADREFRIFWANLEVLKPSIYARPPVPVVVPRFKDRKELPRRASEILERCLVSSFEADDIDATMRQARDDLATNARGVLWLRYETIEGADGKKQQIVHKEHVDRRDFRTDPARKWAEVGWVARRSWLTRKAGLKRFGDVWLKAEFKEKRSDDSTDEYKGEKKGEAWEIWSKTDNLVVWVSPGVDEALDSKPPFLNLDGFYPCPRPAYGTLKRGTLTPVPDFLFYKDQVEEINELTARISALSEQLRLKGFYPAGASDVGDAIEAVLKDQSHGAVLVPINNMAAFASGGGALKDSVIWLPVEVVATVIKELVELRRQLIEDVYQITGISDIMRGQTDPNETKGAQQLKSQYGSIRIRDKQNELVRLARDVTRIEAEIMAEHFEPQTLMDMSQMDDLPTDEAIQQQIIGLTQKAQQMAADPRIQQMAQQEPDKAKQALEGLRSQVQGLEQTVTLEKVVALLREQRTRPFILEIETDSTIQPDEDAAKARASEFITAVGGYLQQATAAVEQVPQMAPLAAEMLKYVASQFRAGRAVDQAIDAFADQIKEMAAQPKGPSPEQLKQQADAQKATNDAQRAQGEAVLAQGQLALDQKVAAAEAKIADDKNQIEAQRLEFDKWKAQLDSVTEIVVKRIGVQADMTGQSLEAELAQVLGIQQQRNDLTGQVIGHLAEADAQAADHQHEAGMAALEHDHQRTMQAEAPQPTGAA